MLEAALAPLVSSDTLALLFWDLLESLLDVLRLLIPAAAVGAAAGLALAACAAVALRAGHAHDPAGALRPARLPAQGAKTAPVLPCAGRSRSAPRRCRPLEAILSLVSAVGLLCLGLAAMAWSQCRQRFAAGDVRRRRLTSLRSHRSTGHLLAAAGGAPYMPSAAS
jgi:hypothetical protein